MRFVAVFRLPPEVLALIFEQLAFCEESTSGYTRTLAHPTLAHPCLHVAQVCTAWRKIALGLPRIWGIVYTDSSKRWLEEIQRRSGSCPLFFRRGRGETADASLSLLREQTHRAKAIVLWSDSKVEPMEFVFGASFPILESLTISGSDRRSYEYTGSAPRLQFLSLANCTINITHPCLPTLQTLIISCPYYGSTTAQLSVTPLATLRHLPNLRYIKLEGPIGTPKLTDPFIELPHLEHLDVNRVNWGFLRGLKRISAPKLRYLGLRFEDTCYARSVRDVEGMFSVLPNPSYSYWRVRLSIEFSSEDHLEDSVAKSAFHMSIYSSSSLDLDSDALPRVKADIYFNVDDGDGCHTAAKIISLLPAGQPEFVHIECSDFSGTLFKPLIDALASFPELHFDSPSSVRLLLDGTPQMGAKSKSLETLPDFPLPGLKRIFIIPKYTLNEQETAKMLNQLPSMREILHNRKKVYPIEVVKLGDLMVLPDKDLELLQQIVEVEILDHEESIIHARDW